VAGAGLSGAKEAPEDLTCHVADTGVSLRSNPGHPPYQPRTAARCSDV